MSESLRKSWEAAEIGKQKIDLEPKSEDFGRIIDPELAQKLAEEDDRKIEDVRDRIGMIESGNLDGWTTNNNTTERSKQRIEADPEKHLFIYKAMESRIKANGADTAFGAAAVAGAEEALGRKYKGFGDKEFEIAVERSLREIKKAYESAKEER